jgi:hypothetical protein
MHQRCESKILKTSFDFNFYVDKTDVTNNVTDHAVEQQAQEQSPELPRSASNTQQLPDGSSKTVTCKDRVPTPTPEQQFNDVKALLSEDDQSLVDTDAIGLGYDAEVSDLPPHVQSKISKVVSQTFRAHLA